MISKIAFYVVEGFLVRVDMGSYPLPTYVGMYLRVLIKHKNAEIQKTNRINKIKCKRYVSSILFTAEDGGSPSERRMEGIMCRRRPPHDDNIETQARSLARRRFHLPPLEDA